jgi:hypothetical protein
MQREREREMAMGRRRLGERGDLKEGEASSPPLTSVPQ